jgi:hypothetical protein
MSVFATCKIADLKKWSENKKSHELIETINIISKTTNWISSKP